MGCCGVVCTTRFIAVLGIVLSTAVIAGPTYLFLSGRDQSEIIRPFIRPLSRLLEQEYERKSLTENTLKHLRNLLDDVGENAWLGCLVSVGVAGTNMLLDLFLLVGACCRVRCLALPWLIVSLLEIVVLGCPTVIFFSILGIYLYVENLVVPALISFSAPGVLVLGSLLVWFIVLSAYNNIKNQPGYADNDQRDQEVQPLMSNEQQGATTSYNLGHYPQYYPPHNPGPSAPPQTTPSDKNNPHLYPTLPA